MNPQQSNVGGGQRPGQMTMAMRAMPQMTGPKVLRIGKVQGGRVLEERVIKQRTHVTVGSSHTNTFAVAGKNVPETMRLFELVGNEYQLNLTEAMSGRVALPSGVTDLGQARASGVAKRAGNHYTLRLTEDSRGKVTIDDTTFLFQFVTPPPVQPKPQLPHSIKGEFGSQVDWGFTIVAAFSFLIHFGFAGAVNSDWFDPIVDDEREMAALIQQAQNRPTPPIEEPKSEEPKDDKAGKEPKDDKKGSNTPNPNKGKTAAAGPAKNSGASMSAQTGAALSNELDQIGLKALASLSGTGPALSSVLSKGATAAETNLNELANKSGGVDTSGGLRVGAGGGGPMMPGAGGGNGLADVAANNGAKGSGTGPGGQAPVKDEPKVPTGDVSTGGPSGASNVKDANSVIARNRWRFTACYKKALQTDPSAGGTVRVQVKVGEGGDVVNASSASSDAPGGLTECIVSAFRSMKFSEPEGGSATFTVPVVLSVRK